MHYFISSFRLQSHMLRLLFSLQSEACSLNVRVLLTLDLKGSWSWVLSSVFCSICSYADTFGAWTPWLALLAAMVVSAIFSIMHAVASITFRADQVVSGVAINMLGIAIALFTVKLIFGQRTDGFYST